MRFVIKPISIQRNRFKRAIASFDDRDLSEKEFNLLYYTSERKCGPVPRNIDALQEKIIRKILLESRKSADYDALDDIDRILENGGTVVVSYGIRYNPGTRRGIQWRSLPEINISPK